jgi:hypothetical protein
MRPKTAYFGSPNKKRPFTGMLDSCTSTYRLNLAKAKRTYNDVNTSMYQYGNIPIFNFKDYNSNELNNKYSGMI